MSGANAGTQVGLGTFDGRDSAASRRDPENGKMNELLSMDEAVEELSRTQVKDVWVRGRLIRDIIEQYEEEAKYEPGYVNPMAQAENAEEVLSGGRDVYAKLGGAGDREAEPVLTRGHARRLRERTHRENVEELFDELTKDEAELSRDPVEIVRDKVKLALEGCGMPRINVQRAAVQFYRDNPDVLADSSE